MFRIDYVGTSPYINCVPSLYHHRLGPKDRFLILSSDGLYQYFTNKEAVSEVELFITLQPEGDPAQHLVEEVLFRAAKKAGIFCISTCNRIVMTEKHSLLLLKSKLSEFWFVKLQVWTSTNYLKYHKGIGGATMMMFP